MKNRQKNRPVGGAVRTIDVVIEALWLAVVFFLPLVFFPNIFTTFELAKVVVFKGLVTLMVLLWFLKHFLSSSGPVFNWKPQAYLWIFLGSFLCFYLIATMFSVAPALSFFGWYPRFQGLLTFFYYAAFGTVIFFELRTPAQKERLFLTIMVSFFAACAIALFQKFLPDFLQLWSDAEFNGRVYGTLANPNYLAGYIVMIVPLLAANIFRNKFRIFSTLCLMTGIAALLFTLSRAGFLALFVCMLFFFMVVAYRKHFMKTFAVLAILPFIVFGGVWYVIAHQEEAWVQTVPFLGRLTTAEENMSSTRSRLEIWPAALRQILVSPLIGFGPETFAVTFPSFAPPDVNTREDAGEIADHPHNELLDIAVQIGIPGMVAFLCFVFGLAAQGMYAKIEKDGQADWIVLGLSSSVLGLFTANEFGFSVTVHWVFLAAFSALILQMIHHGNFKTTAFSLNRFLKAAMMLLLIVLGTGIFLMHDLTMVFADYHMRQAYDGMSRTNLGTTPDLNADPSVVSEIKNITTELKTAAQLSPVEAFYSLNFAHFMLGRMYDGQKLSAVEVYDAEDHALHASKLRGFDGFAVSIALDIKKISGLTF